MPGATRPALYLVGDAGQGYGVHVSSAVPPSEFRTLGASPDVPGRVFVGTSGRGIFVGNAP